MVGMDLLILEILLFLRIHVMSNEVRFYSQIRSCLTNRALLSSYISNDYYVILGNFLIVSSNKWLFSNFGQSIWRPLLFLLHLNTSSSR